MSTVNIVVGCTFFAIWYVYNGINAALNGHADVHWTLVPFDNFKFSIRCAFNRTGVMRGIIDADLFPENSTLIGGTRSWGYQEVKQNNLYAECAKDCLRGPWALLGEVTILWLLPMVIIFF